MHAHCCYPSRMCAACVAFVCLYLRVSRLRGVSFRFHFGVLLDQLCAWVRLCLWSVVGPPFHCGRIQHGAGRQDHVSFCHATFGQRRVVIGIQV